MALIERGLIKKLKERWANYVLLLSTDCSVFGHHKQS